MAAKQSKGKARGEFTLPRWAVPLQWCLLILLIQVLIPWIIAQIGPRLGWSDGSPARWNLLGLAGAGAGIGLYAWYLAFHFRSYEKKVRVGVSPPKLVVAGPYQISRNPMYASGLFAWLGWVVFYGNPAVLIGLVLLWAVFTIRVIPLEERQLEGLFGEDFRQYKRTVRRWIGRY